jgi:pimeloyl-ACP methyl ester carboxylesterase
MTEPGRKDDLIQGLRSDETTATGRPPPPPPRPAYLHGQHQPFAVMVHAAAEPSCDIGVVVCPPFGWDEMASYRPRREWADALAQQGIATLRLDLPGTGDSYGYPTDHGRVDAWTGAIGEAAAWLRQETGCRRIVAIGIGVGGLLAYCATAQGATIDDFVLWGAPGRGRTFIREMRTFARMEAGQRAKGESDDELPPGWLSVGGYVITAETSAALEALDVSELRLPPVAGRHALLLERDGISVDNRLLEALERQRVVVQTMPGEGYGKMMVEPQFARASASVLEQVGDWISALDSPHHITPTPKDVPRPSTQVHVQALDGVLVRESFLAIKYPRGDMFGVLTEPLQGAGEVGALLLGGTGHRIGPNRMWVEAARRWASWGVPTVRLDLVGVGDARGDTAPDVPALYTSELTDQLETALDHLAGTGFPRHMVMVGLCAAAYWAMQASLQAEQEVTPLMVNPRVLIWDEGGHVDRMARHYLQELARASNWKRLFHGEVPVGRPLKFLMRRLDMLVVGRRRLSRREQGSSSNDVLDHLFDDLRDRGRRALILFTGREPMHQEFQREGRLERLDRWPNLELEVIPGRSDQHTLRQIWLQQRVHESLDEALRRELNCSAGDT